MRQYHNCVKRELIQSVTKEGDSILDVGCGRGGDIQKWFHAGANINMCDPDDTSLQEAKSRAKNLKIRVNFYHGDICACPNRRFDIVCFNFSLHYIFQSQHLFHTSLREIQHRIKPGGKLIGIIPDSEKIVQYTPFKDDEGNFFVLKYAPRGQFGEKLYVNLVQTPYYDDGPKPEPVAYKDLLVTHLEDLGFVLEKWEGLDDVPISRFYSKFIFAYRK